MRIIYGHDYYDNALAYGQDDTVIFVREKEHFLSDEDVPYVSNLGDFRRPWFIDSKNRPIVPHPRTSYFEYKQTGFTLRHTTVLFCGKVHTGLVISTHDLEPTSTTFWTLESFQAWLDKMELRLIKGFYWYPRHSVLRKSSEIDPAIYFQTYDASKTLLDWMINNKVVVAIRHPGVVAPSDNAVSWNVKSPTWEINSDRLKDMQFFKKIDAYTAFQEISMWVGGVLPGSGRTMVEIADQVRIEKHGFDKVRSFRNMKRE